MKKYIEKYKYYTVFVVAFIICILRALKGFCWTDEAFYLSTADRFFNGDALLSAEWYRTQLSSVICLPFYALYIGITGSKDGVILFFRFLYLILSFGTAVTAFKVIKKKYPETVALLISVLIIFYAHLNVTALSYYMMSLHFLLLAMFLVYDSYDNGSKKKLVIAGVFYALSVLSLPSYAVVYIAWICVLGIVLIVRKTGRLPEKINNIIDEANIVNVLLYSLIGIVAVASVFMIYLFVNVGIQEIITAVPNIMVDKEHDFTIGYCIRKFFFSVSDVYGGWTRIGYGLIAVCFVFQKFLKKKPIADIIVAADVMLFVIYAIRSFGHTGYIQTALCMCSLPVYFLSSRKNHKMFWLFVTNGLAMSMTYSFSSSDFLYALSIGHFVAAVAGVIFLYDYVDGYNAKEQNDEYSFLGVRFNRALAKMVGAMLSLVVLYSCCVTIGLRLSSVYRDAPINKLNVKIEHGIAKGLYTTQEHLEYYDDVYEVIDEYCMTGKTGNEIGDTIMFSKILPWGYMVSDLRCGYPTTWRATAYNAQQLEAYYEANPGKEPDVIVVLDEQYGSYDASGDVEDDHNPNLDEMNDYWKDYISNNGMVSERVKCGYVYRIVK